MSQETASRPSSYGFADGNALGRFLSGPPRLRLAQEAGAYPVAVKWPVTSLAQPAGSSSQGPCPPGTS
jgi:hypothetical protein